MNDRALARRLLGEQPQTVVRRADGVLVVIGADGRKHIFTVVQQQAVMKGGRHEPERGERQ